MRETSDKSSASQEAQDLVHEGFMLKLRTWLGKVPFAEELCAAWYCAQDPATPARVRGILIGALAYFVLPADVIPDIITGFGFTDDATVIATATGIVSGYIKPVHHLKARALLRRAGTKTSD